MIKKLYYGDNLEILREQIDDEIIDLIYLDPPFNSQANYNVIFNNPKEEKSQAQITAFEDTWTWNIESERAIQELKQIRGDLDELLDLLVRTLGKNSLSAYLAMMAIRLVELHRVLKPTASLYLHCDPTASHYLKMILDIIFGAINFRNEIIWERSKNRSSISRIFRKAHDVILFYTKSNNYTFNLQYKKLSQGSLQNYRYEDERGKYRLVPLLVSGKRKGETGKIWRGIDPNKQGKLGMHWVTIPSKIEEYEQEGLIVFSKNGIPNLKYYLEDNQGVPLNDLWYDIPLISSSSKESLGYPTQKPQQLLERIILASSNENDLILDPFCGCGTTIHAAEKLSRQWIAIDQSNLAIFMVQKRLKDTLMNYKL
jgi:site-specific DNA-methyltransferase (adenine-specific)